MDAGWYQGSVKEVACDSQRSADMYKQADVTVVEVEAVDVTKTSTNKPSPQ